MQFNVNNIGLVFVRNSNWKKVHVHSSLPNRNCTLINIVNELHGQYGLEQTSHAVIGDCGFLVIKNIRMKCQACCWKKGIKMEQENADENINVDAREIHALNSQVEYPNINVVEFQTE